MTANYLTAKINTGVTRLTKIRLYPTLLVCLFLFAGSHGSSYALSLSTESDCRAHKKVMFEAIRQSNTQIAAQSFQSAVDYGMQKSDRGCMIVVLVGYYGFANKIGDPYAKQLEPTVAGLTEEEQKVWRSDADFQNTLSYLDIPEYILNPPQDAEIFKAFENNDFDTVMALIENPEQRNAVNRSGMSVLHYAAAANQKDIVTKLLGYNFPIDFKDNNGRTALCEAAYIGNPDIVELLLKEGANPNVIDINGGTPLIFAALRNNIPVGRLIIDAGANINMVDGTGNTALMLATYKGNIGFVQMLLDNNADTSIKNDQGGTALDIAQYIRNPELIKLLSK